MTQGIHGVITDGNGQRTRCLVIGQGVPRIHSGDGMPVYQVVEDRRRGLPVILKDGSERHLLAYPSTWVQPGNFNGDDWLYAKHENLGWDALIPCFDVE